MVKRLSLLLIAIIPFTASADSFKSYLTERNKAGVSQATSPAALETFVGERILEVKGVIRGFLQTNKGQLLVLENPDSKRELFINAVNAPDWLKNTNTSARLLIKASRQSEVAPVDALLITATSEGQIAAYEAEELSKARKVAELEARKAAARNSRSAQSTASRGGQPPRLPGNLPTTATNPLTDGPQLSAEFVKLVAPYTEFILKQNRKLSAAKAQHIAETILAYSAKYGVDPRLIMALVICESNFNPNATSHAGAQGLGQLMPGTARGLGVSNSYDTEQNLFGTVKLLRGHLDKYTNKTGDSFEGMVLALAAYNAGPGAVSKYNGVPPYRETQNYVRKVIATYKKLCGE
jgi:soluble lytic murein transglycosylase-like protein